MRNDNATITHFSTGVVLVNGHGVIERLDNQAEILLSGTQSQILGQSIIDVLYGRVSDSSLRTLTGKFGRMSKERPMQKIIAPANQLSVSCNALKEADGKVIWIFQLQKMPLSIFSLASVATRSARKWISKNFYVATCVVLAISASAYVLLPTTTVGQDRALPSSASTVLAPIKMDEGSGTANAMNSELSVVGTIEAGDTVSITAPFDAMIKEKNFSFDTEIKQGQLLLTLDTDELLSRLQEAKVTLLRTATTLQELENWEKGAEVTRARRSLILAQQQVEQTQHKVDQAESLLKKGIIPRSEYDGLVELITAYKSQLAAAADDLKATCEKANKNNLEIVRIEHAQAQAKYKELSDGLVLERITAPREGIISNIPTNSNQTATTLEVGSRITKGQLLFNIASTERMWVSARVNEADISDLTLGMKAIVSIDTHDMLPIVGKLMKVSAQAASNNTASRSAAFDIKIEMPALNAEQRHRLRVGMSCNVRIMKESAEIAANSPSNGNAPQ